MVMHDKFQAAVEEKVVCFNVLYQYFACYTAISHIRQLLSDSGIQAVSLTARSFGDNCVVLQWRTEGVFGAFKPPPREIPKALQNRAKLNPIVKTVKNC